MDNKVEFKFHWLPRFEKINTKKPGRFFVSPRFYTLYKETAFRWCIVMYPNGVVVGEPNEGADFSLEDETPNHCKFYLVLQPWFNSGKNIKIVADVEFEIKMKADQPRYISRANNVVLRPNDIQSAKMGESGFLRGLCDQGASFATLDKNILLFTEYRLLVTCRVFIPSSSFEFNASQLPSNDVLVNRLFFGGHGLSLNPESDDEGHDEDEERFAENVTGKSSGCLGPVSVADFRKLVEDTPEKPDITIVSNDGEEFECHSSKLCGNIFFARMFDPTVGFKEKATRRAVFEDADARALNEFLYFMYTGELSTHCKDLVCDLIYLSEKCMVKNLKVLCRAILLQNLDSENVLKRLKIAQIFKLAELKQACMNTIVNQPDKVFTETNVEALSKNLPFLTSLLKGLTQKSDESMGITGAC